MAGTSCNDGLVSTLDASASLLFSTLQVCKITGLTIAQLRYWDRTGFFSPEYADEKAGAFSKVYSFRDVVGLYTVSLLRKRHGFSLQRLRPVGEFLLRYSETPWSSLAIYVAGDDIAFEVDGQMTSARSHPGQGLLTTALHFERVARHVEDKAKRLRRRRPNQIGKIKRYRYIMGNAAVVDGTRVRTQAVWNFHRAGYDADAIIREYPRLKRDDITAAIAYERSRHPVKVK